jgi:hypothetical protein
MRNIAFIIKIYPGKIDLQVSFNLICIVAARQEWVGLQAYPHCHSCPGLYKARAY